MKDIIETLSESAQKLTTVALEGAAKNFNLNEGKVTPLCLAPNPEIKDKEGRAQLDAYVVPAEVYENKDLLAAGLRHLRQTYPVVCFITEAWFAKVDASKEKNPTETVNQIMKQGIANYSEREEVLSVAVYDGERNVIFVAPITREPLGLGEWRVGLDNKDHKFEGRLASKD